MSVVQPSSLFKIMENLEKSGNFTLVREITKSQDMHKIMPQYSLRSTHGPVCIPQVV